MKRKSEFFDFGEWLKKECGYGGVFVSTIIYQVGKCLEHHGYELEAFLCSKPSSYYSNLRKWKRFKESKGESFEIEIDFNFPPNVIKAIKSLCSSGWTPTKLQNLKVSAYITDGGFVLTQDGLMDKNTFEVIATYFGGGNGEPFLPYSKGKKEPLLKKQIKRVINL